ncbi:MAG TPA: hypothetical protein EYP49_08665, partial [Anaerolineae bacterium]|nr:hypothetical protein [Anaerolineae bacterium]
GIIIITTAIKESNFLGSVAKRILTRSMSEKDLALLLVILSALLSTFLTNDITLFIIVPLTISLQGQLENDITKMIIFEIVAVNVGSSLTPGGNPQNLFLWHKCGLSFTSFMGKMLPLTTALMFLLLLFVWLSFESRELRVSSNTDDHYDRWLVALSFVLLWGYMATFELKRTAYALPVIVLVYILLYRRVLRKVDWPIILIFVLMFVDFRLISEIGLVARLMGQLNQVSTGSVFVYSLLISQIISNVPAAVFLSKFSSNWLAIAYGVNVGGNGIVIASLANLIALRMVGDRKIWSRFHKYSLVYLSVSACLIYFLLRSYPMRWIA